MRLKLRTINIIAVALFAGLIAAGCGGTTSSTSSVRLRAVNLVSNGGTGTIYVNSGSANGSQNFDQTSSYLYLDGGISSFSYSLTNAPSITPASTVLTLNNGSSYTVVLVGRADVAVGDSRLAKVIVLNDDHAAVPGGAALLRVMNAAPDTSTIGIFIAGKSFADSLSYSTSTLYEAIPAGSQTLSYLIGGKTYTSPNLNLQSGHTYSLFITEPVVTTTTTPTPTYSSLLLDDDH